MHNDRDSSSIFIGNVYAKLAEKLDNNFDSRCVTFQKCVDLVKGGNSAYLKVHIISFCTKKEFL